MYTYWLSFKVPSRVTEHGYMLIRCKTLPAAKKQIAMLNDDQRERCSWGGEGTLSALTSLLSLVGMYSEKWKEYDIPQDDVLCERW